MRKKLIFHRKYTIKCTEEEFLDFVKNSISLSFFSSKEPYKYNIFKFNGKIDLKKRLISFHHESTERNSIDPKGKINYYSLNDLVFVDFIIELSLWNFFIPVILAFASTILINILTGEFWNMILLFLLFYYIIDFFLLLEYRFHRKLFVSDFEKKMQESRFEYNVEQIYQNRFL